MEDVKAALGRISQREIIVQQKIPCVEQPSLLSHVTDKSHVTDNDIRTICAEIMAAADGMCRNGRLSILELQRFLGPGTEGGRRYGPFREWLLSDHAKHFRRWDSDQDGSMSLAELQNAVTEFSVEEVDRQAANALGVF